MRAVVIRVRRASIVIDGAPGGSIGQGLVVLLGIREGDTPQDADYLVKKCLGLRIFEDEQGKMNKGLEEIGGSIMLVSNFTLYADCSHGRRPDFFRAAKPDIAIPLYERAIAAFTQEGIPLVCGQFGADMQIDHVNDGPVTLVMDTEEMRKK